MVDPAISFELCRPTEDDARQVMAWRNDPATLSASFHRDPKVWDSFWPEFRDRYFAHPDYPAPTFVLNNGRRVGFLKFEPVRHPENVGGRTVDISINLAP